MKTIADFIIKHLPKIIFGAVVFIVMWFIMKLLKSWKRR